MKLFSWSVSWILLRLSFFRDCLTGLKTFQKIRHPGERRIRQIPETCDNIVEQLAVLNGGLFLFLVRSAQQIIHGGVIQHGHGSEVLMCWFCFSAFPVRHGRRANAQGNGRGFLRKTGAEPGFLESVRHDFLPFINILEDYIGSA